MKFHFAGAEGREGEDVQGIWEEDIEQGVHSERGNNGAETLVKVRV